MAVVPLLSATTTATGEWKTVNVIGPCRFSANIVGAATATATVVIDGSNDPNGTVFQPQYTFTLAGATATDANVTTHAAQYVRARITAASFTSAVVNMNV